MREPTCRRYASGALVFLSCLLLTLSPGCAAMTGLVTGAFTGAVDAPAQVYRLNRGEMDHHPEYWVYNVMLAGPIGFATGAIVGFAKGIALDVNWLLGRVRYHRVFTTYKARSVWRPFTIHY
jgi:hypothetical protein